MKKLTLPLIFSIMMLTSINYKAEAQINDNINITTQPNWGPVGYQRADYYYLPDVEAYYSIASRQFIYLSGGRWIYSSALPSQYKKYDLYSGYKVVVNRPRPFLNFSQDKVQYSKFKGWKGKQVLLRDAKNIRNNPRILQPDALAKKGDGDFGPE